MPIALIMGKSNAEMRMNKMKSREYKEGYRNGYLDRMVGVRSNISLSAPNRDYRGGYHDGVFGVDVTYNMVSGCPIACPGCGMIFDPCEKNNLKNS